MLFPRGNEPTVSDVNAKSCQGEVTKLGSSSCRRANGTRHWWHLFANCFLQRGIWCAANILCLEWNAGIKCPGSLGLVKQMQIWLAVFFSEFRSQCFNYLQRLLPNLCITPLFCAADPRVVISKGSVTLEHLSILHVNQSSFRNEELYSHVHNKGLSYTVKGMKPIRIKQLKWSAYLHMKETVTRCSFIYNFAALELTTRKQHKTNAQNREN